MSTNACVRVESDYIAHDLHISARFQASFDVHHRNTRVYAWQARICSASSPDVRQSLLPFSTGPLPTCRSRDLRLPLQSKSRADDQTSEPGSWQFYDPQTQQLATCTFGDRVTVCEPFHTPNGSTYHGAVAGSLHRNHSDHGVRSAMCAMHLPHFSAQRQQRVALCGCSPVVSTYLIDDS